MEAPVVIVRRAAARLVRLLSRVVGKFLWEHDPAEALVRFAARLDPPQTSWDELRGVYADSFDFSVQGGWVDVGGTMEPLRHDNGQGYGS